MKRMMMLRMRSSTKTIMLSFLLSTFWFAVSDAPAANAVKNPPNWGQLQSTTIKSMRSGFSEPNMIYAPFLYWFWDEPIDRNKIKEMTHEMIAQRFNPGYLFAHTSMADLLAKTPGLQDVMAPHPSLPHEQWLSDLWFDAVEDVISITEKAGGYVTYADEYMWPSGRADDRVIKKHPELASASLSWEITDVSGGDTVELPRSFFTVAVQAGGTIPEFTQKAASETITWGGAASADLYEKQSLGQTIRVEKLRLDKISIAVACVRGVTDSGFKIEVRHGGPKGRLIAQHRQLPGLNEGQQATVDIPELVTIGTILYVAMIPDASVTKNMIGWWSKSDDAYAEGTAFVNGEPAAGDRFVRLSYLTRPDYMQGQWIWERNVVHTPHTCWFRKSFELSSDNKVLNAGVQITADNSYTLYINGTKVGHDDNWNSVETYDIKDNLVSGQNVIAIEGGGKGQPEALLYDMKIDLADGKRIQVVSDGSWKVSEKLFENWFRPEFDAASWDSPRIVESVAFCYPWNLSEAKPPYFPVTIRSSTLRLIGSDEKFCWTAPSEGNWRVYTFTKILGGYVNWLDQRLAKAFIEIAHKPYAERFGDRMGKSIPGSICDTEGSYGGLAWSDSLESRYLANTGRDIRLWMPLMLDKDVEGISARARFDWFDAVSDLYSGYFTEVNAWLSARGMYYVSNLWEESLMWETRYVGDFMKAQRSFSMPGMDCLGLKAFDVHDFKETQSVAEFEGRRYESEFLGAGGWSTFNPINMKKGINATTAWGASHIVPHALFMARKQQGNVWVPDLYDENPLWPYMHMWTDFVRRSSYVNSHGTASPDVLLLTPLDSVWTILGKGDNVWGPESGNCALIDALFDRKAQDIDASYSDAMRQLSSHRVEYLISDRHYVNQMSVDGARLVRGDFRFKTVVLPPMVVLPLSVARKIVDFAKAGGFVFTLGELPTGSTDNGLDDPLMVALMSQLRAQPTVKACKQGLSQELDAKSPGLTSPIQFTSGEFPMLQLRRRIDNRDFFWLVNNSDQARQCVVQVADATGAASVWDCETGTIRQAASTRNGSGSQLQLAFQPYEAYWLVFDPQEPAKTKPIMALPNEQVVLSIEGTWTVRIDPAVQPNLEYAVTIPAAWTVAGIEHSLTLWETWAEMPAKFSGLLDYTKTVTLPVFTGELVLDLGQVNHFAEVWINGKHIGAKLWPPHKFQTNAFHSGSNEIRIRVGNLVNNNYGMASPSGLVGPVVVKTTRVEG